MALPLSSASTDRRDDVLRLLADAPEGLADADLADRLGGTRVGVRPGTVNALCRRMVGEGLIERVGTRPIRNRLTGAAPGSTEAEPTVEAVEPDTPAPPEPDTTEPVTTEPVTTEPVTTEPVTAEPERPRHAEAPRPTRPALARDVAQAWSRTVNVQAALASWLTDRGATIRTATDDGHGPARDLVARLDGDDVHVEITGWPPDGARTHPTTVAGDWFAAAEDAARARRRAHPHARIVIALPDTRRYRALRRHHAESLAGAGAEVWFVDPSGAVEAVPG